MEMERIFITGNADSGKTTLSKKIGAILNKEVISLDSIIWQPGWIITAPMERSVQIGHLIKSNRWIIDGVSKELLKAADTIIFLDCPRIK
jgi:adenylate kinase family enzyme